MKTSVFPLYGTVEEWGGFDVPGTHRLPTKGFTVNSTIMFFFFSTTLPFWFLTGIIH